LKHALVLLLMLPFHAFAEPGYLKAAPPPSPTPTVIRPKGPLLEDKFLRARGLKAYEVQTLHYNRVSCVRRLFSQSGLSLEGDADLKSTNVGSDLAEIEFPAHVDFTAFNSVNPFANGVQSIETMTGRRLVRTHPWPDEKPLVITKKVTVRYEAEDKKPELVDSVAEIRVTEESYPSTFIVKETVMLAKRISIYYLCR
jgi:hypothetical protein